MEFFATVTIPATPQELQRRLTIATLPDWCTSIERVLSDARTSGEIYGVWGTFLVTREELQHGVRFSLPGCSNALQWTVTTGHKPNPLNTVVHLSINRSEQEPDFVESIQKFVADWKAGLETHW